MCVCVCVQGRLPLCAMSVGCEVNLFLFQNNVLSESVCVTVCVCVCVPYLCV